MFLTWVLLLASILLVGTGSAHAEDAEPEEAPSTAPSLLDVSVDGDILFLSGSSGTVDLTLRLDPALQESRGLQWEGGDGPLKLRVSVPPVAGLTFVGNAGETGTSADTQFAIPIPEDAEGTVRARCPTRWTPSSRRRTTSFRSTWSPPSSPARAITSASRAPSPSRSGSTRPRAPRPWSSRSSSSSCSCSWSSGCASTSWPSS